jgi:hypothetical protein
MQDVFIVDLHRKFQFFNFAARKMNIFSRLVEVSTQENYPWIGTDKKIFLCVVSSGMELMTLTQKKFLSVPIHG